jgi:hypothetical protein
VWLELLQMAFAIAGFFLLGCLLVIWGIAMYFCLEEPRRLAIDRTTYKIIAPQPLQVSLAQTNVVMLKPPLEAYFSGAATNAAIWINGKAFKSAGRGAWELVMGAWRLWLLGAGTLICGLLLRRYGSALKTRSALRINNPEPGGGPNGDPALPSGKSGAAGRPPSVS